MMPSTGRILIAAGIIITLIGIAFLFGDRIPFLGKLPGNIYIQKGRSGFYFPLTTCIVISVILTIIFYIFRKQKLFHKIRGRGHLYDEYHGGRNKARF